MSKTSTLQHNWDASGRLLVKAAGDAGIDPNIMVKIAGFESGFNSDARPIARNAALNRVRQFDGSMAVSSAHGLGQFVDGTWLGMIHLYGEKYGVAGAAQFTRVQANAPGIRQNPELQAAMLAEFTRDNISAGARLGGPDPVANVYAMHNLGPGDAAKFLGALRSNPNEHVSSVLSRQVIGGNPSLYGNGTLSVAESYRAMGTLLNQFESYAQAVHKLDIGIAPARSSKDAVNAGSTPVLHVQDGQRSAKQAVLDGTLRFGEHSHDVAVLQRSLDRLGYRSPQGHHLLNSGRFDENTLHAVQSFQLDHGLNGKGIYGPRTQAALHDANSKLVTAPTHPHHALYEQTLEKVRDAERSKGTPTGTHSERIAAALTTELIREGITRVDRVEFNDANTLVRAVQVSPMRDEAGLNRASDAISAPQASVQSIAESSRQMHEVAVNIQARQQDQQFLQSRPQASLAH